MDERIRIRRLESIPEMVAVTELEKLVWGSENPVCVHQLLSVSRNGGFLLGAFCEELMVGMLFSYSGFLNGQVYLWSDMMGIRKEWRSKGIGAQLKRTQAETAKAAGYPMIAWTYDPLETANGYLNIGKLGAICSTYHLDYYGDMEDQLNQGIPSDRFQIEWWLDHQKGFSLPQGRGEKANTWILRGDGLPQPGPIREIPPGNKLTVGVPADFQALKKKDFGLAKAWREITRRVFIQCFGAGWAVAGFCPGSNEPVHTYVLVPRGNLPVPKAPWQKGA